MAPDRSIRPVFDRLQTNLRHLSMGGSWAAMLPLTIQHNLRSFFFDGVFSAASDAVILTYLTLFVLALGATNAQIGLMAALGNIIATLVLLPGAMITEKTRSRKDLVVWSGGGISRLVWLGLAVMPFLLKGQAAVITAIGLKLVADAFGNLAYPAWTSLTGDIVPLNWRGRYFGTRNIVMGAATLIFTYLGGTIITKIGGIYGYQIAFAFAFVIGMVATYAFSQIREPRKELVAEGPLSYSPKSLWKTISGDTAFLAFLLHAIVWNFSINIAGPFFTVFQAQVLQSTATMIGLVAMMSSLASLPAQRFFGLLSDRWGDRRVMTVTMLIVPLVPVLWAFATKPWHPLVFNVFSGIVWAGYHISSFNYLLSIPASEQRARYTAIFQLVVAVSSAVGAALGGQIVTHWGYAVIFIASGVGRLLAALIFIRFSPKAPVKNHEGER